MKSCPTRWNPMDCSLPGSSIPGILQARVLEWVAISFSNAWKWKSESEVTQSCPTLSDPTDCSLSGSSIYRSFQAGVLEWVASAFSVGHGAPKGAQMDHLGFTYSLPALTPADQNPPSQTECGCLFSPAGSWIQGHQMSWLQLYLVNSIKTFVFPLAKICSLWGPGPTILQGPQLKRWETQNLPVCHGEWW